MFLDKKLYRGARPDDFSDLASLGIKTSINLEVGYFEFFHGLVDDEKDQTAKLGIRYVHEPIDDVFFPSFKELDDILFDIEDAQTLGPVFLHCLHGQDRTGIVCAAYRVKIQKWSINEAIQEMLSYGYHTIPYDWLGWTRALRKYLGE